MAVGHNSDIVAIIIECRIGRFHEQVDHARRVAFARETFVDRRAIAKNLAIFGSTPARAGKVQLPLAPENTLAAGKQSRALGCTLLAQIVIGALGIFKWYPFGAILLPLGHLHARPVARVDARRFGQCKRFQPAALGKLPLLVRDEPVQQAIVAVFGQIGDAGARVDTGGLMVEAAHRFQRHRIDQSPLHCGHFEDIAVVLANAVTRLRVGFLTGQPTAPRRNPARAIADSARKTEPLGLALAGFHVVDQRRRAPR